jgi:hypothetical protein
LKISILEHPPPSLHSQPQRNIGPLCQPPLPPQDIARSRNGAPENGEMVSMCVAGGGEKEFREETGRLRGAKTCVTDHTYKKTHNTARLMRSANKAQAARLMERGKHAKEHAKAMGILPVLEVVNGLFVGEAVVSSDEVQGLIWRAQQCTCSHPNPLTREGPSLRENPGPAMTSRSTSQPLSNDDSDGFRAPLE